VGGDAGTLSETDQHCRAEDCLAIDYGMIYHRSSLKSNPVISKEASIVCCCSWWTFWTLSLEREDSWHSAQKCLNCWRKNLLQFQRY